MKIVNEQQATVFQPQEAEKRKNTWMANLSTFEGKDQEGKNIYASWRSFFVGDAYEKAKNLKDRDRIVLTNSKIENNYDKEKEKLYVTLTVFDFEMAPEKTDDKAE